MALCRVRNLTRGYSMKRNQALRAVENCSCAWVDFGVSVRDLTWGESVEIRKAQAKSKEPLPFAEIPGLVYRWPGHEREVYTERQAALEANQFSRHFIHCEACGDTLALCRCKPRKRAKSVPDFGEGRVGIEKSL